MEYYIAAIVGGAIICLVGLAFQRIIKRPITARGMFRDFLVGLGVVATVFYNYPDVLSDLSIPTSDLEVQIG